MRYVNCSFFKAFGALLLGSRGIKNLIPAIDQSIRTGFLKGYPGKTFKPEQKISRSQVLVALVSGFKLKAPSSPNQVLSIYKDTKDIPDYATDKVAAATANGLVVNYPNTKILAPNKEATRSEVGAMVHQALVQMGKLEQESGRDVPAERLYGSQEDLPVF